VIHKAILALTALLCIGLYSGSASAKGFTCNNNVVREGDTTFEVKKNCGAPDAEENIGYVKIDDAYVTVVRYFYDLGNGRLLRILEFRNGVLYSIESGPRS
jgi:hypothetical protein